MKKHKILLSLAGIVLLALLAACTGPQVLNGRAYHRLAFNVARESVGIELLYYRYGSVNEHGLRTTQAEVREGLMRQAIRMSGDLPVGEEMYVKWRDKNTGKVYEDTVDLRSRLPFSMYKQELHFFIEGAQLYVYLISFDEVRPYLSNAEVSMKENFAKTQPLRLQFLSQYSRNKVIQIYPVKLIDPHVPPELGKLECPFGHCVDSY